MSEMEQMLKGYRLTTAEILYHLPDYPDLLQTFLWQQYDLAPRYPILGKFINFWHTNLEGKLHSVRVASLELVSPSEMTMATDIGVLH